MTGVGGSQPPSPHPARLFDEHRRMVEAEARVILRRRGLSVSQFLDDAVQDGFEGLAHAAERFEAERGTAFGAYARPFVRGAIVDALDGGHRASLGALLRRGADPRAADFVLGTQVSEEAYESAGAALSAVRKSLEGYLFAMGLGYLAGIRKLDPESALTARREHGLALQIVQEELARLPERDQRVLSLRVVEELVWDEVARRMSVSLSTAQRWHGQALHRLGAAVRGRRIGVMPSLPDDPSDLLP